MDLRIQHHLSSHHRVGDSPQLNTTGIDVILENSNDYCEPA